MKRSLLPPLLTAFDFPDVDASCETRFMTTQPGQALSLLHDRFVLDASDKMATRIEQKAGGQPRARVAEAVSLALARPPTDEEIADGTRLVERLQSQHGRSPHDALKYWCLTILNSNEFLYLD